MEALIESPSFLPSYNQKKFGLVNYVSVTTVAVTSFGNLFQVLNLPLDEHTDDVFTQLKQEAGVGVIRLASWPDKFVP